MATFDLGNVPSPITQAMRLAQLREIQDPNLALQRQIQQAVELQRIQQQSPENQLALQIKQAQLASQLEAQPLEQERQRLIVDQLRAQLDPNFQAQQNAANLAFEVDKARQLGQVANELRQPKDLSLEFRDVGDAVVSFHPVTGAEVTRTKKTPGKVTRTTPQGLFIGTEGDETSFNLVPGTGPIKGVAQAEPVIEPATNQVLGYMVNGKFESAKKLGAGAPATSEAGIEYARDASNRILASVASLRPRVSRATVGMGSLTAFLPESPARNFEADLKTLKSGIFVQTLQAMRNASKTGGAVGQVSNKEGDRFENALGALDQAQSPENFRKNLNIIEDSTKKFLEALQKQGVSIPATTPRSSAGQVTSPVGTVGINPNAPSPVTPADILKKHGF